MRALQLLLLVGLTGCTRPGYHYETGDFFHQTSNDPCKVNPVQCAETARIRTAADQKQQATEQAARAAWQSVVDKAAAKGYKPITVHDMILDGADLAKSETKVQTTGFYRRVGDAEILFASFADAVQTTRNFFPVLTDDAQRPLRARLMTEYGCNNGPGCSVNVGGHVTLCKHLSLQFANYPEVPCLHVEVVIQ